MWKEIVLGTNYHLVRFLWKSNLFYRYQCRLIELFSDPTKIEKHISVWLIQYLYIALDSDLTSGKNSKYLLLKPWSNPEWYHCILTSGGLWFKCFYTTVPLATRLKKVISATSSFSCETRLTWKELEKLEQRCSKLIFMAILLILNISYK